MRRWNGWGDDAILYPAPASAVRFIERLIGPGRPPHDAAQEDLLKNIPASRMPAHPLVSTDPLERLKHARGQSAPDWIALRGGCVDTYPDGVAYPADAGQVRALLQFAGEAGARLIPYGGGTSVVGHINPLPGEAPVLTVDMSRMNRLEHLDEKSHLATFGAGVTGPDLEAQLRARGFTLGHYPQSFELSTLGGWVATRSSGQQSLGYGRIEKLFAGGRVETPSGRLDLPSFPASAAGPDLKEIVLGCEGRLGILTHAVLRVTPIPAREDFHAVFFPDFERGMQAVCQILWAGIPLSMLRLSTPMETTTTLALAGHERLIGALERLLSVRGMSVEKCMLMLGFSGRDALVKAARKEALDIAAHFGGVHVGRTFGEQWQKSRFRTPYLRNTLWEMGYLADTLETAADWSRVPEMVEGIEAALHSALQGEGEGERAHVFTHLSHLYPYGSSIYTTYLFRLADDPQATLHRWQSLKVAASRVILEHGGTISHQHGVGIDHREYLPAEKGSLGMAALRNIFKSFDPQGMMNPGKLV
jgi:alkyldihydroxyacetonephosphate synthase